MAIKDDFSVDTSNNIRHASGSTIYSVLDLHALLQDLADDASPSGDDNLSILSANPSKLDGPRDTNSASRLNLLSTYNIDDTAAQYLKFGSIKQTSAATMYSGLKTIGSIVSASPVYVVQNNSKLTKFWSDGHIQILVKVKTGGSLIDSGLVRAYSRKYGQSYSDFEVDLSPGGETAAALATTVLDWVTLSTAEAAALSSDVTITVGDVTEDLGNGNGPKLYKGTITLSNGCTLAEAAQYLHYICREDTSTTINSIPGWRYRVLDSSYTASAQSPFGYMAGGTFFVAQGWWLDGVLPSEATRYQLVSHDGQTQSPPNVVGISIADLVVGDSVLAVRDDGAGSYIDDEYTLNGTHGIGTTSIVVNQSIAVDTPDTGPIRIGGIRYTYSSYSSSTKTFTLSSGLAESHASGTTAFVPFIDKVATATTEQTTFIYSSDFVVRLRVRNGSGASPIVPFETTFNVTTAGGSTNAIRTSDV